MEEERGGDMMSGQNSPYTGAPGTCPRPMFHEGLIQTQWAQNPQATGTCPPTACTPLPPRPGPEYPAQMSGAASQARGASCLGQSS